MANKIAVLMGSDSDRPTMQACVDILKEFGVETTFKVLSAHRTPKEACAFAEAAEAEGYQAVICAAGLAAHLAGVVAAHTMLPVIGCPMDGGIAGGLDALLSTVQMPGGIPVASMGVGKHGAKNAALFVIAMMANHDPALRAKYKEHRAAQAETILSKNK